jgi:two-component system NarL family sensor kinase
MRRQTPLEQLATLNSIGDLLNRESSFAISIGPALERLTELVGLTSGWVFTTNALEGDAHRSSFRLAAHHGLPPALDQDEQARLARGSCECMGMFSRGQLDRGVNMVTCSRLESAVGDCGGLEVHASVPLLGQRGPVGILNLTAPGDLHFDEETLAFLSAIGKQLGTAFERSRLQEASTEEARYAAALEERHRLAQEMHDSVAQLLFAADLRLTVAQEQSDDGERQRAIDSASDILSDALSELQGLVEVLRPADLSCGLGNALRRLAQRTSGSLEVQLEAAEVEVEPAIADPLYRIAQEAVHNALRHSGGRRVQLRLSRAPTALTLTVQDDGVGFDPADTVGGLGLAGIRDRAADLGGRLAIDRSPDGGTRVEVEVPWPPA